METLEGRPKASNGTRLVIKRQIGTRIQSAPSGDCGFPDSVGVNMPGARLVKKLCLAYRERPFPARRLGQVWREGK